jgi:glycosyltransferase involved in cell wall biosynthesis
MPTYRRARQIGETLRSLLDGRFTDFELLVRDDGDGADGTAEAVASTGAGDQRVIYHRNARRLGMPGNLNQGIKAARGWLVAVCHDHDLYAADFLTEMVAALDRHPSALFVHCAIEVIDQDGRGVSTSSGAWPEIVRGREWLRFMLSSFDCPVCALTVVRREAYQRLGLYDPAYGFVSDVEMWMRLSLHGDVAYLRRPLIQVREREENHEINQDAALIDRIVGRMQRRYLGLAYAPTQRLAKRLKLELRVARRVARNSAALTMHRLLARLNQ